MALEFKSDPIASDETLVQLSEDQLAVVEKSVKEIYGLLSYVETLINDNATVGKLYVASNCLEGYCTDLTTALGQDSNIETEKKHRFAEIKSKNIEIRRLEDLIGSKRGLDGIAESLSMCRKNFAKYWDQMGFCLVNDHPLRNDAPGGWFGGWGKLKYIASLSTMLSDREYVFSKTPKSDKNKKVNFLEEMHNLLDLQGKGHGSDLYVLDTTKSRAYIEDKLKEKYPSLLVSSWNIQRCGQSEEMQIRSLQIEIQNPSEMLE